MRTITISRDDRYHKAWPSVAVAANGNLVVTYKESDGHLNLEFSTLVVRISPDRGRTWGERIVLYEVRDPAQDGLLQDAGRICALQDGSLLIAVSQNAPKHTLPPGLPYLMRYMLEGRTLLFRSFDHGQSWQREVASVNIPMISTVRQLRSGVILIGATFFSYDRNPAQNQQIQVLFRSGDNGRTWEGPITVCADSDFQPSEGDFVELDDGTVVCYIRDEDFRYDLPLRQSGLKCVSRDEGLTWEGPYSSGRWLFNGRMSAGLLPTGEVMVTTRLGLGRLRPYYGTFHDEPWRKPEPVGYWHGDFPLLHAYLESQADATLPNPPGARYAQPLPASGRWLVIDNDLNPHPDFGYSGWVNLPSGEVFVVDFITDDAPAGRPQIRGYILEIDELRYPDRRTTFDFGAPPYQLGRLAGQADWVHHVGPLEGTVEVVLDESGQVAAGRAASSQAPAEVLATGWMAPTLDAGRVEAETVRRDIGPFNLYDEPVTIEFEHRGQAEHGALEVLDDCQRALVSLRCRPGANGLQAIGLAAAGPTTAIGPSVAGWLRSRVALSPGRVSVTTLVEGQSESKVWFEGQVPGLEVVAALALRLGGQGDLVVRRIRVTPHRPR